MKPLVSILIPAYNSREWIADTLRSAIAQTWPNKEIIVVDDGSTDQTLAIARQFESDTVHVFTQKNQGAAATRNTAFSLSHGDYIQWLDADDLLAPDKISKQLDALGESANKRTLLSGSWGQFMYRYRRTKFIPSALWCDLSPAEWLVRKMSQNAYMQTASWLASRELSEAAGTWDTRLLGDDDGEYFCRVLLACDGVRFVPESKIYYRASGPGSLSYVGRSDKKREAQWCSIYDPIGSLVLLRPASTLCECAPVLTAWAVATAIRPLRRQGSADCLPTHAALRVTLTIRRGLAPPLSSQTLANSTPREGTSPPPRAWRGSPRPRNGFGVG